MYHSPHHRISTRIISIIAAVLPGIGCFILLIYTFIFQSHILSTFTIPDCPNVTSILPPVSYAIGVWEPQRLVWQAIMFFHFPARVFMGYLYFQCFDWEPLKRITAVSTGCESLGLIALSIVHINAHFILHAIFFGIWLISFNLNIIFHSIMHITHDLHKQHRFRHTFFLKLLLFPITFIDSIILGASYPYATKYCNLNGYTIFCICEYLIIAINSFYYSIVMYEYNYEFIEIRISSNRYTQSIEIPPFVKSQSETRSTSSKLPLA